MAAPYVVREQSDGHFTLAKNDAPGAPQPTDEEMRLAARISRRLDAFRNNREDVVPNIMVGLKEIAELGLTRDAERNLTLALRRFSVSFGDVRAGPFSVGILDDEIKIDRVPETPEPSDDQRRFLGDFIERERFVRALYEYVIPDENKRKRPLDKDIDRLAWAARLGLQGPTSDIALARIASETVFTDVMREHGVAARGIYLRSLAVAYGACSLIVVALTFIFWLLSRLLGFSQAFMVPGQMLALTDVALLSLAVGAWLIAAVRLQPDSPEVLNSVFATLSPYIRAVLVMGFGFLGLVLFYKQLIVFSFGPGESGENASGFTTAQVFSKLSTAVLAGGLLGIGDAALPSAVIAWSGSLLAALARRSE